MKSLRASALILLAAIALAGGFFGDANQTASVAEAAPTPRMPASKTLIGSLDRSLIGGEFDGKRIAVSDTEWKKILTPEEFYVLRKEGTERAYTGTLTDNKKKGTYHCAACGLALFSSSAKYDSETGWPSFFQPIFKKNVTEKKDNLMAEERVEVECARCGSHLGHVFDDGPEPTGLRYCMNSVALKFAPAK